MRLDSQINIKTFYRVTGTPENFLTALRYSTWGFNNIQDWNKIVQGDIIFFHSKGVDSKFKKKYRPCIVGFGVVGNNFFYDKTPLWIDEKIDNKSYPYRFQFSEIYLFAGIPINDEWDSTTLNKPYVTGVMLDRLTQSAIPLSSLTSFPHMGSYSRIANQEVKRKLLDLKSSLFFYPGVLTDEIGEKSENLTEISNIEETLRFSTSLTSFDDINERVMQGGKANYNIDRNLLVKAEKSHFEIIRYLKDLFDKKGYKVYNNNHVDLFVHNKSTSLLIEAKSIENNNFKSQSRKGIVQLFEYNYFEVNQLKYNQHSRINKFDGRPIFTQSYPLAKFEPGISLGSGNIFRNRKAT